MNASNFVKIQPKKQQKENIKYVKQEFVKIARKSCKFFFFNIKQKVMLPNKALFYPCSYWKVPEITDGLPSTY